MPDRVYVDPMPPGGRSATFVSPEMLVPPTYFAYQFLVTGANCEAGLYPNPPARPLLQVLSPAEIESLRNVIDVSLEFRWDTGTLDRASEAHHLNNEFAAWRQENGFLPDAKQFLRLHRWCQEAEELGVFLEGATIPI